MPVGTAAPLRRALGRIDLIALGVGATIGAGIFVITGSAAALHAGPAVVLSMVLVGIACVFVALCFAELASAVPSAGSAYSYTRLTMGDLAGWMVGWDLLLEFAAGAAAVAVGWSGHFVSLLRLLGVQLPAAVTAAPAQWCSAANVSAGVSGCGHAGLNATGALINVPAVAVVLLLAGVLIAGVRASAAVNGLIVAVKVSIILLIIGFGVFHVDPANWQPLVPPNTGEWGSYGWSGVLRGAGLVFFAFIGFDAVATAAQESRNPQRDLPIGILGSLLICTLLYVLVAGVLTGMVPYADLNRPAPMAHALERIGAPFLIRAAIDVGATLALGSVVLVFLLAQTRLCHAMSTDGFLGRWAGSVHPRTGSPVGAVVVVCLTVAAAAGFLPLQVLGQLGNMATLLAFLIVCVAVLVLRRTQPALSRPFRVPLVPLVPLAGLACSLGLMLTLPRGTWLRLLLWLALGLALFLGRRGFARS